MLQHLWLHETQHLDVFEQPTEWIFMYLLTYEDISI